MTDTPDANRDARGVDSLLERYLPALQAFVRLRLGPSIGKHESVSDLVQSVCREVLGGRERFVDQGEPAFRGWLFTTALRKIVDKQRYWHAEKRDVGRRVHEQEAAADAGTLIEQYATLATPSREASLHEQMARVEAAMQQLSEEQREIVTLHKIAGLSHADISKQLGKSEENCRQILRRSLVKLAELLDEQNGV